MAEWGVGREARTTVPAPPVESVGVRPPMPPHSQGAERRTGRRAGRWALRALVIGGLAGAAWLLSGSAAHATDRDPTPGGSLLGESLIGSVLHGDSTTPMVSKVLNAAIRPVESDRTIRQYDTVSVLGVPVRVFDEATRPQDTIVHDVVGELTGPLRLTGGPAESPDTSVTPSHPMAEPDEAEPDEAEPDETRPDGVPQRAIEPAAETAEPSSEIAPAPMVAPAQITAVDVTEFAPATTPVHRVARTGSAAHPGTRRHAAVRAAEPETVREYQPDGDGPAPVQVHLGTASGLPAGGSGAASEGGSMGFLPAAVAAGTMASHRLPIAADVEVRRTDAVAPTVSPD